jgi:hypothetical protein
LIGARLLGRLVRADSTGFGVRACERVVARHAALVAIAATLVEPIGLLGNLRQTKRETATFDISRRSTTHGHPSGIA